MKLQISYPSNWPASIHEAIPDLLDAAQAIYDGWAQDENGLDIELGAGGICHEIADRMSDVLAGKGWDVSTFHQSVGENHVFLVVNLEEGVYSIDIPPSRYETGSGYVWKKKDGVVFSPDDLAIDRLSDTVNDQDFAELYG